MIYYYTIHNCICNVVNNVRKNVNNCSSVGVNVVSFQLTILSLKFEPVKPKKVTENVVFFAF